MKLSQKFIFGILFFAAASFASPSTGLASASTGIGNHQYVAISDTVEPAYNSPNLNASDGFDESEYKRKIQQKPKKKQRLAAKDLVKHNL